MWTYVQSDGRMFDRRGTLLAVGYSGKGAGKNNVDLQFQHNVGPIPEGIYAIEPPVDTTAHGPFVLWLDPDPGNDMGIPPRSGFGIHGDSYTHPGDASDGCIILPRFARERIWESGDTKLQVIARMMTNAEDVQAAASGEPE